MLPILWGAALQQPGGFLGRMLARMNLPSQANPFVVVIGDSNGAGKSTTAPILLRDGMGVEVFVNADVIAARLRDSIQPVLAIRAGRIMLNQIEELSQSRQEFAFETTLSGRSYAPRLRQMQNLGYWVHILFLWLSSSNEAVTRVARRVQSRGHHIPDDVVRRRYHRGITNFVHLYTKIADSWQVVDNSECGSATFIAHRWDNSPPTNLDDSKWQTFLRQAEPHRQS